MPKLRAQTFETAIIERYHRQAPLVAHLAKPIAEAGGREWLAVNRREERQGGAGSEKRLKESLPEGIGTLPLNRACDPAGTPAMLEVS